ncbi:hypothetical protein [Paraburkholderia atlantica]|uniref:hypothetical protein n=1 Tax=Paraburkholderia atlantica TaxID=2654982 RepID=UPI001615B92E|nr:hypothetical protein [Paraburkholderia atlantica]MBB5414063.1 hypothetical protein [Paraburkholderia atlantica]
MRSPMVTNLPEIPNKDRYTELKVLKSPAGYYVGTMYWDAEYQTWDRGSRDSGYFATEAEAAKYLQMVESVENPQEYLRNYP